MRIPGLNKLLCPTATNPYAKSTNLVWSTLYKKSFAIHQKCINETQPERVEKYFEQKGIPATFKEGTDYARKFIAYCCYHTAEIFKQLGHELPVKLDITDFRTFEAKGAIGITNFATLSKPKHYPIRSVVMNTLQEGNFLTHKNNNIPITWENYYNAQIASYESGTLSTPHFLSPFIHEFAHNLHYHKLFSKFGCQEINPLYRYNPNMSIIFQRLNMPIKSLNPYYGSYIQDAISKDISVYASGQLPETFAEYYTKSIVENMDLLKLRLTDNPFTTNKTNPTVAQVLNETWEGMAGDGHGLV